MAKAKVDRSTLLGKLGTIGQELSTRMVLFHHAVAEKVGVSASDLKCLTIAMQSPEGDLTPSRLVELTGLTSGAITGVLDRLERAGFVRRENAPNDRRQILIRVLPDRLGEFEPIFGPYREAWGELCADYDDEQLALIYGYLERSVEVVRSEIERVRTGSAHDPSSLSAQTSEFAGPFTQEVRATLELTNGVSDLEIAGHRGGPLYKARFEGPPPKITAVDGVVRIAYRRRLLSFGKNAGHLTLNTAIPWRVIARGGVERVSADLSHTTLEGLEIRGGVHRLDARIAAPSGTVAIRITQGVDQLELLRPEGVPVKVEIKGGAHRLTIDTLELGDVGGKIRWESPDYAEAEDRYELTIGGGVNNLAVKTYV